MKNNQSSYAVFPGRLYGGKASSLIKMKDEGFSVPTFFVIPAEYFISVLSQKKETESIEAFLKTFDFPEVDKKMIFNRLPQSVETFSVRSSAVGEDGATFSFAGQFETFLHVTRINLFQKIKEVWISAFSDRIVSYKKQNKIEGAIQMAVVIQSMVNATSSGVMFGINPITQIEGEMLISGVYGLGEGLVSGELNADNYYLKDGNIVANEIAIKNKKLTWSSDKTSVEWQNISEAQQEKSVLTPEQIQALHGELIKLNQFYNYPQDVEWAYQDETLHILQSRPITNLQIKEGTRIVWDNSNIVESYPGTTTPLTFSFIRDMYEVVYMQFSELLGVKSKIIKENSEVFENMLGLLRGRVYYNLLGWYKALALLPGYHLNAEFMEGMMGVKERFELSKNEIPSKSKTWFRMIVTIWKMIVSFFRLPRSRRKFLAFLDVTISEYKAYDFDAMHPELLVEKYKIFEKILVEKWNPPLVNDFFAMIFFGVFQKLVANWIDDKNLHLCNDLLAHSNDIISVQPMYKSLEIAKLILEDQSGKKLFLEHAPEEVWRTLEDKTEWEIKQKIDDFLYKFGERCLGELKLETISYTQDPSRYIKILQSYVKNPSSIDALDTNKSESLRKEAQKTVREALKWNPLKRWIFNYFLNKTRDLVSNRENLRFERTRGFGIVRTIFSAMGKQFKKREILTDERDIFYLTKEEIFDFINGTSVRENLQGLVDIRKTEFAKFEEDEYVPERITTYGTVYDQLEFVKPDSTILEGDIKGIACCAGVVKAPVSVIHSPDEVDDLNGRIMVTTSTDPGWVSLFPTASAILVERGSLLSHSAIVARELGIPCIVGITGLLSKLKTGNLVEMDGSTGFVKIISDA